jgi:hypothetical protein
MGARDWMSGVNSRGMTGNGTKGRIMPALPGRMKKLNWIDDEARSLEVIARVA